jgi:hypothetical protein
VLRSRAQLGPSARKINPIFSLVVSAPADLLDQGTRNVKVSYFKFLLLLIIKKTKTIISLI